MAYNDPSFTANVVRVAVGDMNSTLALGTVSAVSGGTDTYTGTTTGSKNGAYAFRPFAVPTNVRNVYVFVKVAPGGGVTNQKFAFLNGTSTFATVTIGTATVSSLLTATMVTPTYGATGTQTNAGLFATAGVQPTMTVTNTNTATASTLGEYLIYFEESELFQT
jgi:hypothetical protein